MKTFKVLAALLDYPQPELLDALPALRATLDGERMLGAKERRAIDRLLEELRTGDLIDLQERYVGLFDRVRSLSLHLFEHVHGESRDRGQAMVDLKRLYATHGLEIEGSELPDYLPVFLEFLSVCSPEEAREQLGETAHIIEALEARLRKRESAYASVLGALLAMSGAKPGQTAVSDIDIRKEDAPETLDALWQEEPAFGGSPCATGEAKPAQAVMHFHRR